MNYRILVVLHIAAIFMMLSGCSTDSSSPLRAEDAALLRQMEGAQFILHDGNPELTSSDIYEIKNSALVLTYRLQSWIGPMTKYGCSRLGDYVIARMPYRDGAFSRADDHWTYVYTISSDRKSLILKTIGGVGGDQIIPRG